MSTLPANRCDVFLALCCTALIGGSLSDAYQMRSYSHRRAGVSARACGDEKEPTNNTAKVALPLIGRQVQQQVSNSVTAADDESKPDSILSFLGRNQLERLFVKRTQGDESSTGGYTKFFSTRYVPLQSANTTIHLNSLERHRFSSLVNTGAWQAFFPLSETWKLNPRITNDGDGTPEWAAQKRRHAVAYGKEVPEEQGVSHISQLWKVVRNIQQIIPSEALRSRAGASPTTCILCALLLTYLYFFFQLVSLCSRLRRTERQMQPHLHTSPPWLTECPPQRQGLPSGAVLIETRNRHRSGDSGRRAAQHVSLRTSCSDKSCPYRRDGGEDVMHQSYNLLSSVQCPERSSNTHLSRWQYDTDLRSMRSPDVTLLPLGERVLHGRRMERSCTRGNLEGRGGSVTHQRAEGRQTQPAQSGLPPELREASQPDGRGQSTAKQGAGCDEEICCTSSRDLGEALQTLPTEQHRKYMLLCYPAMWKDAAYDPYHLESSMRCVNLSPKEKSVWFRSHHYKTHQTFSDEQQEVIHENAALRLAATHIRRRSFAWWEAYLAMCCGRAYCLLCLSVYGDAVRFSSAHTFITPGTYPAPPSRMGIDHDSQPHPRNRTALLSSLLQIEENKSLSSAAGLAVALLQWLASLCLLRACLVDYKQFTTRRQRKRARNKEEVATATLSLSYLLLLLFLVPSLINVPAPARPISTSFSMNTPPHTQQWHKPQIDLQPANITLPLKDRFRVTDTWRDVPALKGTSGLKGIVSDAVMGSEDFARHTKKRVTSSKPPHSFLQFAEKRLVPHSRKPAGAVLLKVRDNSKQNLNQAASHHYVGGAHQITDKQDRAVRSHTVRHLEVLRMLRNLWGNDVQWPLSRMQQTTDYKRSSGRPDGESEDRKETTFISTVRVLLLLLCHAVPRVWAFYAALKLRRENGVSRVWRSSNRKPSYTTLVSWMKFKLTKYYLGREQRYYHSSRHSALFF